MGLNSRTSLNVFKLSTSHVWIPAEVSLHKQGLQRGCSQSCPRTTFHTVVIPSATYADSFILLISGSHQALPGLPGSSAENMHGLNMSLSKRRVPDIAIMPVSVCAHRFRTQSCACCCAICKRKPRTTSHNLATPSAEQHVVRQLATLIATHSGQHVATWGGKGNTHPSRHATSNSAPVLRCLRSVLSCSCVTPKPPLTTARCHPRNK